MTFEEIKPALIPMVLTGIISVISTFMVTVGNVSANGEQGRKNGQDIKEMQKSIAVIRENQSAMDAKIDLLVEVAKLNGMEVKRNK